MSAYRQGIRIRSIPEIDKRSRYRNGITVSGFFSGFFPSNALKELNSFDSEITLYDREYRDEVLSHIERGAASASPIYADDIAALTGKISESATPEQIRYVEWYRRSWKPFFDSWIVFYRDSKDWKERFMSGPSIWDRIQEFRNKLGKYRSIASSEFGFDHGTPDPTPPKSESTIIPSMLTTPFSEGWAFLKIVFYALIGIAGVATLAFVLRGGGGTIGGLKLVGGK